METVKIKINNREYTVEKGLTILEAARSVGIKIPTLCYLKDYTGTGACRVCMVVIVLFDLQVVPGNFTRLLHPQPALLYMSFTSVTKT